MSASFSPGSIVRARGREWLVLSGSKGDILRLRPAAGSEAGQTVIHVGLEVEPVREATFPPPPPEPVASHDAAVLLRDALLLSLRRGAGPFRSFGQIAVEPRAYQLVPLLMAMKLDPVRLLIADDVGIGKTIEAALIARELQDRGDIRRLTVLCPPHLVDQWTTELEDRFHFRPVAVTAGAAKRLENELPPGASIFEEHAQTVVSLDYIKSDRRRAEFLRACPELVIVDEAHVCSPRGRGRQLRYELLRGLSEREDRHMVLLTATPHSGDEDAFHALLGILHPDFAKLGDLEGEPRQKLRERLAGHFVQRRRPDIDEWQDGTLFPKRETKELTYRLTGDWERFFEEVLDYCAEVVASAGEDERRQRLNFWGTLALMRCVASSPEAAAKALRTRAGLEVEAEVEDLEDQVFDGGSDILEQDDVEPSLDLDQTKLNALVKTAEKLRGAKRDPKLDKLAEQVEELLREGFSPVVFCRYIATANYVGEALQSRFLDTTIDVVTGELSPEERKLKVHDLGEHDKRLLVATDCLSEGINLQMSFDAVVHYDLSWNPTRHEQREGRVDRFGQPSKVVRAVLMYGSNNPVDGAVLEVILRKAETIRKELGVPVPLPDDEHSLTSALMKAVFLRRHKDRQKSFDFAALSEAHAVDVAWTDAAEKAKKNRTVFAQRRLKPEDVLPEWEKALSTIGSKDDVQRFVAGALARLGTGLEPISKKGRGAKAPLAHLPDEVKLRLEAEGLEGTVRVDFDYPPAPRCLPVGRSHPLVSVLAEHILERTLDGSEDEKGTLARAGAWVTSHVEAMTTVALVRLRHQLVTRRGSDSSTLLVEEAAAVAWTGRTAAELLSGANVLELLTAPATRDLPAPVRGRRVAAALEQLDDVQDALETFARMRGEQLLADHRRIREAADARGSYGVTPLLPPDVVGLFVLLPED